MVLRNDVFTVVTPNNLWKEYSLQDGLYRCGRPTHPALKKLRLGKDIHFALDPFVNEELILPHPKMGISFGDSIATLKKQPVSGVAWILPKYKILPEGLLFNYRDKYHPLLNVSRKMPATELLAKLNELSKLMTCTNVRV
ncbi:hypothetical protein [Litoribacillus peritrichatus]|uniref:LysR substrate-binding domain-containing protein n=1 Tax=Litoribacillus peritrichatus TaxID=718191 RepID=A0ABP7MPB8_9GAMM